MHCCWCTRFSSVTSWRVYRIKSRWCVFGLRIRWTVSPDFGTKSDLGHRILRSEVIPSGFAISDYIRRPIYSLHRKVEIWSLESDRVKISDIMLIKCGGIGFRCRTDLADVTGTGFCLTEPSKALGTSIDVVPIPVPTSVLTPIPTPKVPLVTSYRTYQSVRYRYWCRTELTEVFGTDVLWRTELT